MRRVEQHGFLQVAQAAHDFAVDTSTIRRDLEQLHRTGLLERARGGALRADYDGPIDVPYELRQSVELAAKTAIARTASLRIRDGETILLDSGSTTYQLVPCLRRLRGLTVVTNDLHIAHALARRAGTRLIVAGGTLLGSVYTLVGPQTLAALSELHVDHTFLGADAIDHVAGITNRNLVEVAAKRAMIAAAQRTTVLADSTKLEQRALAHVAALSEVSEIITDDRVEARVRHLYADLPMTYAAVASPGQAITEPA